MHSIASIIAIVFLVQTAPPAPLSVADGEGAWSIRVLTSGGLTGRGAGNATLTSTGSLNGNPLTKEKIEPLMQLVAAFDTSKWPKSAAPQGPVPTPSFCMDCIKTQVTLVRREGGSLKVFSHSWDDITKSNAPPDVVRLAEMVLTGKW